MFELIQGLKFLINKKKMGKKEFFTSNLGDETSEKSDIDRLENEFNTQLEKYTKMYQTYASGYSKMTPEEDRLVKSNIEKTNNDLMKIIDELYKKITEKKIGDSQQSATQKTPKLKDVKASLQSYEKTKNLYNNLKDPKIVASFDAFEEDFNLKVEMERIRYIIWGSLAIIVFVSAIVWLILSVEFPKPIKIGIIGSTALVALGFLAAIWAVAIKYCQQASKKGILCILVYFLNKFFKGIIDFLQTII